MIRSRHYPVYLLNMRHHQIFTAILLTVVTALSGCVSIDPAPPDNTVDPLSYGQPNSALKQFFSDSIQNNPDQSGHKLLLDGKEALAERLWMVENAENRIDVQYFLWDDDLSGQLFMQQLLRAADRGVKVRILIDGFSVANRNRQLASIDQYPNIELRVYNPFAARTGFGRILNFLVDFERLNRRMHNKSLIVDQTLVITGGRNIGDHYFGFDEEVDFLDADILSVGPVVNKVANAFDYYWSSNWSVPVSRLPDTRLTLKNLNDLKSFVSEDLVALFPQSPEFSEAEKTSHLNNLTAALVWAPTTYIADVPARQSNQLKDVAVALGKHIDSAEEEVLIESAYFVVDETATDSLRSLSDRGVRIRVLTNSLASNNLIINHASYAMTRDFMLENGLELYEMRPQFGSCFYEDCSDRRQIALHAKTAVIDRSLVYVGSMNLNLRSAYLNTESAMFIESETLAFELTKNIHKKMNLENSWQAAKLNDEIFWVGYRNGELELNREEPESSWLERIEVDLLTRLPGTEYY